MILGYFRFVYIEHAVFLIWIFFFMSSGILRPELFVFRSILLRYSDRPVVDIIRKMQKDVRWRFKKIFLVAKNYTNIHMHGRIKKKTLDVPRYFLSQEIHSTLPTCLQSLIYFGFFDSLSLWLSLSLSLCLFSLSLLSPCMCKVLPGKWKLSIHSHII